MRNTKNLLFALAGFIIAAIGCLLGPWLTNVKTLDSMQIYLSYLRCLSLTILQISLNKSEKTPVLDNKLPMLELLTHPGQGWATGPPPIDGKTFAVNEHYLGWEIKKIPQPDRTVIIYLRQPERLGGHDNVVARMFRPPAKTGYRAVLFANLNAKIVSQAEWDSIKKQSHID